MERAVHRIGLLIGALLLLMLLAVFRPPTTGTADRTIFHTRLLECDAPLAGPEHTFSIAFNDQFCVRSRATQYHFAVEGGPGRSVRLLLYHEPYRLFLLQRDAEREIDLDGNGEADITITLLEHTPRGISMRLVFPGQLSAIAEEIILGQPVGNTIPSTVADTLPVPEQPAPSPSYLSIATMLLALLIVLIGAALLHHHIKKNS